MGATLVFALSMASSIGVGVAMFLGINVLLNGVGTIVATSLIGEIFGILSCCLPFSLAQLFGGVSLVATAVITFLTARKIFSILTSILGGVKA